MKKEEILRHTSAQLHDGGYIYRIVKPGIASQNRVSYTHRDDYYILGVIVNGEIDCRIDFQNYSVSQKSLLLLSPGQVHQFIYERDLEAFMLAFNPILLDDRTHYQLEQASIVHSPVYQTKECADLYSMFELLSRQNNISAGRYLAKAIISIIADEIIQQCCKMNPVSSRKFDLMLKFRKLLTENIREERRPGFYADKLNISPIYLNEIVKDITGLSSSQYIKKEIVLLAKRELFHTTESVKEIAYKLGFYDNAYFTRLFTDSEGVSPNQFRENID
ncbi:MAG: helix-turn-helix domain-containing protein [Bacteroidales bacterium]|nr:helix-turn-helix domain-containing protein [Bacteroidales bacterium]